MKVKRRHQDKFLQHIRTISSSRKRRIDIWICLSSPPIVGLSIEKSAVFSNAVLKLNEISKSLVGIYNSIGLPVHSPPLYHLAWKFLLVKST